MKSDRFIGWDIGGTKSSAVVGTCGGEILARRTWPSETSKGPEAMRGDFLANLGALKERYGEFSAVGVSVGGPLDPNKGIIHSPPHLPGWDDIPLLDLLRAECGLPVVVEHDAAACLLAEHLWGGARAVSHAAYLTAGTGCGAGIMIGGKILRGPSGQTAEIGHIRLSETGPVLYGKAGSVEAYCSGTGLALLAHEMFPSVYPKTVSAKEIAEQSRQGNDLAKNVLLASARGMGRTCALLGDLFSPQVILIGSLARYLPDFWMDRVREEFVREVLPQNGARTRILPSELGDRLQDLSAIAPCVFAGGRPSNHHPHDP
ncbi:MAG: ROK family protein [Terrimicrobiaceae bacterium]